MVERGVVSRVGGVDFAASIANIVRMNSRVVCPTMAVAVVVIAVTDAVGEQETEEAWL